MAVAEHVGQGESGMVKALKQSNQLSINIFLTEKFLGKCWHKNVSHYYVCEKCGFSAPSGNLTDYCIDLFTPTGFFILWKKAQEQEWWPSFIEQQLTEARELGKYRDAFDIINSITFPVLLATYLGWKMNDSE